MCDDYDDGIEDTSFSRIESELDLGKIYLKAKEWLSRDERIIFCYIILGDSSEEIAVKMHFTIAAVHKIKKSLIKKLRYFATSKPSNDIDEIH